MYRINHDIEALQTALDINAEVRFMYMKKSDGSLREARGTRLAEVLPERPKSTRKHTTPQSQLCYYDLDKQAWRSLDKSQLLGWFEE